MAKQPAKKPSAKPKRKVGRPRIQFDLVELGKLGAMGCTDNEIAAFFDCTRETVAQRKKNDPDFSYALEKGRENGKSSLRRMQWKAAQGGNITMQIWLGKQLLGQRDHREPPPSPPPKGEKITIVLQDDTGKSPLDE